MVCHRMRRDLRVRTDLERRYPGALLQVQYEKFVRHPIATQRAIYHFLNLTSSTRVESWLNVSMNALRDGASFGTRRRNATATAYQWETNVSYRTVKVIGNECRDLLEKFNYL